MEYLEYLKSPYWQKRRLEIFDRDGFMCRFCGDHTKQLHVHHLIYLPNKMPWEYKDEYLITLCSACHADEEKLKNDDLFLIGNFLLAGLSRRDLYSLAAELRRYLSDIESRPARFQNLMSYLYE